LAGMTTPARGIGHNIAKNAHKASPIWGLSSRRAVSV
jgi:hypothetical protein